MLYAQDHDLQLPYTEIPLEYWFRQIAPYAGSETGVSEVFRCPSFKPTPPRAKGVLGAGWGNVDYVAIIDPAKTAGKIRMVNIEKPSRQAFLVDGSLASNVGASSGARLKVAVNARTGHRDKINAVFWDGHVETIKKPKEDGWTDLFSYLTNNGPLPE